MNDWILLLALQLSILPVQMLLFLGAQQERIRTKQLIRRVIKMGIR